MFIYQAASVALFTLAMNLANFSLCSLFIVTLLQICPHSLADDIDDWFRILDKSNETEQPSTSEPSLRAETFNQITDIKRCGRVGPQFTGRRIVGGRSAALDEFPYQIALEAKMFDGRYSQFCGGTVIADRWVLTAAHCVRGQRARNLRVLAGTNDLSDSTGKTVPVAKLIAHERYNARAITNDIALIKLAKPLSKTVKGFINPICLPSKDSKLPVSASSIISGYGTLSEGGSPSKRLLATNIPIQPDSQCERVYGSEYQTPMMMCAGDLRGGKDTCQGDSGGPLAVRNKNGTYVLVGVTSFGQGCARAQTPGVYTRVTSYIDWIVQTIKRNQ